MSSAIAGEAKTQEIPIVRAVQVAAINGFSFMVRFSTLM
jgi:hypothetical protein